MKRLILAAALLTVGVTGLWAQDALDCNTIVLAYFNGDANRLANYPDGKIEWCCQYARNAFYVSDTVPAGAEVKSISEVVNRQTGEHFAPDANINLSMLNYYAYSFHDFQLSYRETTVTICFSTPGSEHPYLVLRSIDETYRRTEFPELYENR